MPGRQSGDNKLGLTPYIVGQVLGDGCLYDTIQSAIDDAFAAGGGVVGIRPSTSPYIENLTLRAGVDLYGFSVDGRIPSALSKVVIQGNHTFTQAGGFGIQIVQYITFSALAGDTFTMNATGGGAAILAMKFSGIEAQTVAGQRAIAMNPDAGASCQFSTDNTNVQSNSHCFENIGLGSASAFLSLGNTSSASGDVMNVSAGGNGSITGRWAPVSAGLSILNAVTGNGGANFSHSELNANSEIFLFGVGGGSAQVSHCSINTSAASGNWIDGLGITSVTFGDILLSGGAQNIGATVTQSKINWQPYGETALAALGSNRGTSSYDSTQFTVTDGFVQNLNGLGITSIDVDAFLFPGTDPVPPDAIGSLGIFAVNLATNGIPIQTRSISANAFFIELQRAGAALSSSIILNGTCHFNDTQFSIDTDGFVQILGTASTNSFPTDAGTATPVAGVINILGGPGVTTSAAGNTISINSVIWSNAAVPVTVAADSGTFDVVGVTMTLPAAPVQGEECRFFSGNAPSVIQANAGQQIQIGNTISSVAGTATGTDTGDSLVLVYFVATTRWCSVATNGNWTLA